MKTFCHSDSRSSVERGTTGNRTGKLNFPQGDSMMAGSRSSGIFISLSFFLLLFSRRFSASSVRQRERLRVISRGWVDSSLINGFKVSLIESNFLVLPVILIRRRTDTSISSLSFFSKFLFESSTRIND